MPFTYRRSKKIGPVRVHLGKRGVSLSTGGKYAGLSLGKRGLRSRVSLPGTGLSYRSKATGCVLLVAPLSVPLLALLAGILLLAACQPAAPVTVEVTRAVPVTQIVEQLVTVPVEVTRIVEVPVTRPVEVTRIIEVEVTRALEVTRIVQVEVTRVAQPVAPRPTAPPASTLTPEAVVAAIQAAGLEAENVHPLTREEYKLAPYVGSGLRFLLPSRAENYGGRIFLVPDPAQRQALRSFYEEMGQASAILSSYLYERENILLQLPGDLPAELARQYEAALQAAR